MNENKKSCEIIDINLYQEKRKNNSKIDKILSIQEIFRKFENIYGDKWKNNFDPNGSIFNRCSSLTSNEIIHIWYETWESILLYPQKTLQEAIDYWIKNFDDPPCYMDINILCKNKLERNLKHEQANGLADFNQENYRKSKDN